MNNKIITTFPEFEYFTKVSNLGSANNRLFESVNLEKLYIPEGVTTLNGRIVINGVFGILRLPSTVTTVNAYAPSKIANLICLATTPPSVGNSFSTASVYTRVYVPDDSLDAYKTASNWSKLASKMYPLSEYED